MKRATTISLLAIVAAIGCASSGPTTELVDARRAYDRTRTSDAQQFSPDRVLAARQALEKAEVAHADDPGSTQERDLAYIALRKSEIANVFANVAKARRDRETAEQRYTMTQDRLRREAEQRAEMSRRSLEQTQGSLQEARQNLATQGGQLRDERQARQSAEQRAAAAIASLEEVAKVKEEARGTVITLEGALLFATGKFDLLPIARQKLDQVAEALKDLDDNQTIVVEGHTDSKGSDDMNLALSQNRANTVREYLTSRGVKPERITAFGRGENQPVTSNDSAEGRANNRRVEIVIQKARFAEPNGP